MPEKHERFVCKGNHAHIAVWEGELTKEKAVEVSDENDLLVDSLIRIFLDLMRVRHSILLQ